MVHQIVIRTAENSDQDKWDAYVLNHPNVSPYHLFAWKKAVEAAYGHKSFYLMAEQDGDLVGVLPLIHLHCPLLVNELTALPFGDIGNCLCEDSEIQDHLLNKAISTGEQFKVRKIHLRGKLISTDFLQANFKIEQTSKVRMLLNLPSSSKKLLADFKSKLRSQIRKAEKNGVGFRWGSLKDIDAVYSVFSINMKMLGSPVHSKKWVFNILEQYKGQARVGLVEFEEQIIGMGIILICGQSVSIPWASTLREHNYLNPNMLLYWNFLKFSADNGFKIFDFGRSTEEEGTYRFKKQWGAQPEPLIWYTLSSKKTDVGNKEKSTGGGREKIEEIWRKVPLSVANLIGPHLRKYISL